MGGFSSKNFKSKGEKNEKTGGIIIIHIHGFFPGSMRGSPFIENDDRKN